MRRPPFVSLSAVAASVLVAGTVVLTQAGGARSGIHEADAAAPATTVSATKATAAQPRAASALDPRLTASIKSALSKATSSAYGVVVDVEGVGTVVDVNGGKWLPPASTEKLFTLLPLLLSRPQDRLVTTVAATTPPLSGIVHGDLVVHAGADPTQMGSQLVDLARQVRNAGVRKVTGRLVLDIGNLSQTRTRVGWKSSYVPTDVGPLSPYPVHYDTWRTSWSYVSHPTSNNLALLRSKLKSAGVTIVGGSVVATSSNAPTILATHSSSTIAAIIAHTLRESDNFDAEQLLNIEGWGPVHALAQQVNAPGQATDGSGLSLWDRRTTRGEVALLKYAHTSAAAELLLQGLPVGCRSGTLKDSFCRTIGAGHVFAKTGTLNHVKALAGYTTDAQGRWVTFSILTSGDTNTYKAMKAMERAVLVMRHYGA